MEANNVVKFYYHSILVPLSSCIPLIWLSSIFFAPFNSVFPFIILGIVLFAFMTKPLYSLIKSKPSLMLSKESLYIDASDSNIFWTDIEEIKLIKQRGASISIKLKDKEKYIFKNRNPVNRAFHRISSSIFHGTFQIPLTFIKGKNEDIFAAINNTFIKATAIEGF
ncbi:MAG: hypothetical protein RJA07_1660 [Bacteroidota bacterium]|jgi:hypothetical protein